MSADLIFPTNLSPSIVYIWFLAVYYKNPLINKIKDYIKELETNYLYVEYLKDHKWYIVRQDIIDIIRYNRSSNYVSY